MKKYSIFLLYFILTACGNLPRPFETYDNVHQLTHVPRSDEISISPIENASDAQNTAILESINVTLSEHEFIAHKRLQSSLDGISPSLQLKGALFLDEYADDVRLGFEWRVLNKNGEEKFKNNFEQIFPKPHWQENSETIVTKAALEKFSEIISYLKSQETSIEAVKKLTLYFYPIDDFKSKNSLKEQILRVYMIRRLRILGADIVGQAKDADYFIKGSLIVSSIDKVDNIKIQWKITDKNNEEIFSVNQDNTLPKGNFFKNWDKHYPPLAEGAVQGMLHTLKQLHLLIKP